MNFPGANDVVPVADLMRLNEMLRKSGTVGYQTPTAFGSDAGSLSQLIPQSLESTLASATFTMNEIVLWKNIAKVAVGQTVHEYNVVKEHGLDLSPYMAEGGVPAMNRSEYERRFLKIKFMAERREITDIASTVNPLMGPNATALAEETERGTLRLMQKVERELWHGDESVNSLGFDGIIKQIGDESASVTDLQGATLSAQDLQDVLADVYAAPRYGAPDCIYMEPRAHASLINQTVATGRHDQLRVTDASTFTFGAKNLNIMSPYGSVPVKSAPFLFNQFEAPSAASGDGAPAQPTITSATLVAGGNFAAGGEKYNYSVVGVSNSNGYSTPSATTADVTPAAGNKSVDVLIAKQSGVDFWKIYRKSDQTGESGLVMIGAIANDPTQATTFTDKNDNLPNTSTVVMVKHSPDVLRFARLLDYLRRPLAEVQTTRPFLLMLFGAPIVAVPSKCHIIKNVGIG